MGILDPTASAESTDRKPLAERVDGLSGKRIGLFGNGKQAADPVLDIVGERLRERYDDVAIETYYLDELNLLKDDAVLADIEEWASEHVDVGIAAMGDCGSCTKFLTWQTDAIEEAGVPAVGLVEEGFVPDWKSNSIERGRSLRYQVIPVRCEVTDRDRIREGLTMDVIEAIEDELTRPRQESEHELATAD